MISPLRKFEFAKKFILKFAFYDFLQKLFQ